MPALSAVLAFLSLREAVRCSIVNSGCRDAARSPETLAGANLRIVAFEDDSREATVSGMLKWLQMGSFRHVASAEVRLMGRHVRVGGSWLSDMLEGLPSLRMLKVSGPLLFKMPIPGVGMATACIRIVAQRLEALDIVSFHLFGDFEWEPLPLLRKLSVFRCRLAFTDLETILKSASLHRITMRECHTWESQVGILRSESAASPEEVVMLDCAPKLVLTLLLSVGLSSLATLRLDTRADAFMKRELARSFRRPGDLPNVADAAPLDVLARAEAELRAELRRREAPEQPSCPWQRLRRWLDGARRRSDGPEVVYSREAAR